MKVAQISAFSRYSVGNIMTDIQSVLLQSGHDCKVYYFRDDGKENTVKLGKKSAVYRNGVLARIFDNDGFCFAGGTRKLIKELKAYQPDVIHIHNLHGYYFNCKVFFKYLLQNPQIKVVWTMHDNWAITGHCAFAQMWGCEKWKTHCERCVAKKDYPKSYFDFSSRNYKRKKELFTSLPTEQLTIVSPSEWLDGLIAESYLAKYPHTVICNGIDVEKFKNDNLPRTKTLLAIASVWDERKNLAKVLETAKKLQQWKVTVVGKIAVPVDKNQYPNVTFIDRTSSFEKLREIYNTCSVMLNPTLADNLPTVNIEAQLCGMQVLSYDTGGAKETDIGNLRIIDKDTPISDMYLDEFTQNKQEIQNVEKFTKKEMTNGYLRVFVN